MTHDIRHLVEEDISCLTFDHIRCRYHQDAAEEASDCAQQTNIRLAYIAWAILKEDIINYETDQTLSTIDLKDYERPHSHYPESENILSFFVDGDRAAKNFENDVESDDEDRILHRMQNFTSASRLRNITASVGRVNGRGGRNTGRRFITS